MLTSTAEDRRALGDPPGRRGSVRALREGIIAFVAATVAAALLFRLGQWWSFVGDNLHGFIAIVFLYTPTIASRCSGLAFDYSHEGALRTRPARPILSTLAVAIFATWPVFVVGFFWFYGSACQPDAPPLAQWWWQTFAPICPRWLGGLSPPLRLPPDFVLLMLSQVLVVALPEELFFRGYLWARLEAKWPSHWRVLGAPLGYTWLVSSAVFAVGHLAVDLDPHRLLVFFPALVFGWMRARSASIVPGLVFHALCNLLSDVLYETYFR